jgi:hypothetical protein
MMIHRDEKTGKGGVVRITGEEALEYLGRQLELLDGQPPAEANE